MTNFILHRVNTIEQARNQSDGCGAEIDIRLDNRELVVAHDPFQEGCRFSQWLDEFAGTFLVINVKEMGLEESIIDVISKKQPLLDYFFLDQSTPYLLSSIEKGYKCAARVSEYETAESAILLKTQWLWVDSFTGNWDHIVSIRSLQDELGAKKKLCVVSPELQGRSIHDTREIEACIAKFDELGLKIDAVCTKSLDIWKQVLA